MRLVVSSLWPGTARCREGARAAEGGREGGRGRGGALGPMLDLLLQLLLLHGHKIILIVADYNETSNPQQD